MNPISAIRSESSADQASDATGLIRGLGWLGVGVGLSELAFPKALASIIGVDRHGRAPAILRAMGLRELASGIAILARPEHPAPRWARVIGDALDLGLLGLGMISHRSSPRSNKRRLAMTIGAIAGITALDVLSTKRTAHARHPLPVIATVTIDKPPRAVYEFVRKFDQLPRFMAYLASVEPIDDRRSRWTAKLPIGGTVSWEAEIVEDRPGEVISWKSAEGSTVETCGRVTFTRAPGRDSTEIRLELQLGVLGSTPSTSLARLLAKPEAKGDLRRLKQVLETGEVLYSDASAHHLPHPAQPSRIVPPYAVPKIFLENPPTAEKGVTRGVTQGGTKGVTP